MSMLEVYEHHEDGERIGRWIGGSRFRECLEACPDEDELLSTGALSDPWETDRLHLSATNSRISASRSAPPTPAYPDQEGFKWHAATGSSGSESSSPVSSFLPKLVRRLSGRVAPSSDGRKLRKRRIGSSPNTSHRPLSPGPPSPLASPALSDRGFNLFRQSTNEEPAAKQHYQRPPNRRSFSLPLVIMPKRQRASKGSASSHDADISQDSAMDENAHERSFDVVSRPSPRSGGLTLIDEGPVPASPPLPSPGRSRVMSSPPRPNAREIFGEMQTTPTQWMQRRHSITTPSLSKSHSGTSSIDTIPSPTKSRGRPSTAPEKCLLPLAASTPSLLAESTSDYDHSRSSCSFEGTSTLGQTRAEKQGEDKDPFYVGAADVRVYGEDVMLGSSV